MTAGAAQQELTRGARCATPATERAYRETRLRTDRWVAAGLCFTSVGVMLVAISLDLQVFIGELAWALPRMIGLRISAAVSLALLGIYSLRQRTPARVDRAYLLATVGCVGFVMVITGHYSLIAHRATSQTHIFVISTLALSLASPLSVARTAWMCLALTVAYVLQQAVIQGDPTEQVLRLLLMCIIGGGTGLTFGYYRNASTRREFLARQELATANEQLVSEIEQRKRAEEEILRLRAAERAEAREQWRSLVSNAPDLVMTVDASHRVLFANRGLTGSDPANDVGQRLDDLVAEDSREGVRTALREVFAGAERASCEITESDAGRTLVCRIGPIRRGGETERAVVIATDVTEQRTLEMQLRHAQKIQALGTLAGGVAHDFNNLLTVILGSAELLRSKLKNSNPDMAAQVAPIEAAGNRAADLTRQLLAFSHKQVLCPKVIDVAEQTSSLTLMLQRLIGEPIKLHVDTVASGARCKVDPGQLEQVIVNLVVNARDAMPEGGTIKISVDSVSASIEGEAPQSWVRLRIQDSGCGMDAATRERIFEPFFTTKGLGKGTGLGLAMVHGIVTQSGGRLEVDSTVGQGTRFDIHLPQVLDAANDRADAREPMPSSVPEATGTLLVCEDEAWVRELIHTVLSGRGYRVEVASGIAEARAKLDTLTKIDVLLTDVVLPDGRGSELLSDLQARHPDAGIVLMSGYTGGELGNLPGSAPFLHKPFGLQELVEVVGSAGRHRPEAEELA